MILRKLPESEKRNSKIKKKEKQCIGKANRMKCLTYAQNRLKKGNGGMGHWWYMNKECL